ncbi:MAG: hypothetical protein WA992_10355, partial [Desulfobulbales bacterium]
GQPSKHVVKQLTRSPSTRVLEGLEGFSKIGPITKSSLNFRCMIYNHQPRLLAVIVSQTIAIANNFLVSIRYLQKMRLLYFKTNYILYFYSYFKWLYTCAEF